jgi:leucine efflux protein
MGLLDLPNLASFVLASALLIVLPGPATFYVLAQAQSSRCHAATAVIGIVLGDVVLIIASALGFASLISQWPVLLPIVKVIGAGYLLYLSWTLWTKNTSNLAQHDAQSVLRERTRKVRAEDSGFVKGLLLTLTNPKPILFFAAFFPQFIPVQAPAIESFLVLGLLFELLNMAYFALIVALLQFLRQHRGFNRLLAGSFNRIGACGILLCSVFMLASAM